MWRIWVAALFWGLNWPIVKVLLDGTGPWTMRALGLNLGFLVLAVTALASGQSMAVPRAYWGRLAIAGFLNVACFNTFAVFAQLSMPASRAVILTYTMPLWSVVFARLMLGEKIDGLRAVALALGAGRNEEGARAGEGRRLRCGGLRRQNLSSDHRRRRAGR